MKRNRRKTKRRRKRRGRGSRRRSSSSSRNRCGHGWSDLNYILSTYVANISYQRLWYESYSFIIPDIFQITDESLDFSDRIFWTSRKSQHQWFTLKRLHLASVWKWSIGSFCTDRLRDSVTWNALIWAWLLLLIETNSIWVGSLGYVCFLFISWT